MIVTKSYCNECVNERNHTVLHAETTDGAEEEHHYHWRVVNEMLKCMGCDTISLRRTITDSIDVDSNGQSVPSVSYFPPAIFRKKPEWIGELSVLYIFDADKEFLGDLINEIYVCVQNDCRRSAGMAVRALLEQVMIDKISDQGSFIKNIAEFQSKGYISQLQREFLETVIEAGHATIHRAYKPTKDDIVSLVNIAESVVESCYVNEHRIERLRKRIPPKK